MASAKQIVWRKKFARMSKAGKFKKSKKSSSTPKKSNPHQDAHVASYDEAWKGERDYFYRPIRTKKSNPHNDDGYYITKEGSLFVLRQKRFKDRLDRGKKEHPHDVMAYGRTRAEINRMRKSITKS